MINLMKADLYRIFRGVGIYIAMIMIIVMSTASVVMKEAGYIGNASVTYEGDTIVEASSFAAEEAVDISAEKMLVRSIMAANINLYYPLILVVFVILMSDFSNKTLKNTLTSAVSKRKYFAYKLLMSLGCSAVFIIFSNLFAYILNYIKNGSEYTEPITNILKATALQMPMLLGIVGFLVFMGFLTRKTAVYNATAIPFVMLFQIIIGAIYRLSESKLIEKYLMRFELQTALDRLAYFPESKYCLQCLCFGVVEIAVFALLSWVIFKKAEVK